MKKNPQARRQKALERKRRKREAHKREAAGSGPQGRSLKGRMRPEAGWMREVPSSPSGAPEVWFRMRHAEGALGVRIMRFALDRYGRDILERAWTEYTLGTWSSGDFREAPEFDTSFLPWFLYNWIPDAPPRRRREALAMEYVAEGSPPPGDFERRFARAMCTRPYSFYAITEVERGRSMRLKDIVTGMEHEVLERKATEMARCGGIVYGRVLSMEGVSIVVGMSPLLIPPHYHSQLLDFREALLSRSGRADERVLQDHDSELRSMYFTIVEEMRNPPLPKLQNTDGDPLVPTKLYFDLRCAPREALKELSPLALDRDEEELIQEATTDARGELQAVTFSWLERGNRIHKGWDNTVMGTLSIQGTELVAEVNSERRATMIRAEIEKRLPGRACYRTSVSTPVEELLRKRDRVESEEERKEREEEERFMALPEVREELRAQMKRHWESWLDQELPALRNQSPREAARTSEGRERLEALLHEFEWGGSDDPILAPPVAELRAKLGLVERGEEQGQPRTPGDRARTLFGRLVRWGRRRSRP